MWCALASGEIEDYWFASGTSTYLINQMQRFKTDVTESWTTSLPSRLHSTALLRRCRMPCLCSIRALSYYQGLRPSLQRLLSRHSKQGSKSRTDGKLAAALHQSERWYFAGLCGSFLSSLGLRKHRQGDDADEILACRLPGRRKGCAGDMQKNEHYYETVFYIMLSMMNIAVLTQVKSCRAEPMP